jgi:Tfp pilus assembly protein PilF
MPTSTTGWAGSCSRKGIGPERSRPSGRRWPPGTSTTTGTCRSPSPCSTKGTRRGRWCRSRLREITLAAVERAYALGREALAQGDPPQARNWFRVAFSRDLRQFQERFRAAAKLLRRGRFEDAVAPLEEAIEIQAHFADVHNDLGVALVESGQAERGEASFRRSVELNPDYLVAHLNLAATQVRSGRRTEAEEQLRFVLEKDPQNAAARSLLEETLEPGPTARDAERIP